MKCSVKCGAKFLSADKGGENDLLANASLEKRKIEINDARKVRNLIIIKNILTIRKT